MSSPPQMSLERYLADRSVEAWRDLCATVAADAAYHPDDGAMERVAELVHHKDHAGAIQALQALMPNWLTNPGAHQVLAYAMHKEGDVRGARRESFIAEALVDGILATGDGTAAHPWHVLRTEDEYDVLLHVERQPTAQLLVDMGDRKVDAITCEGGTVLHFDVTVPLRRLAALGVAPAPREAPGA